MALIIKCRKCSKRIPADQTACPGCGGADLRYIVDYRPNGRRGGRKQIYLPLTIASIEEARAFEQAIMNTKHNRVARIKATEDSSVAGLFPEYLIWYRKHRSPTTWEDVSGTWERDLKKIFGGYIVTSIEASHYSLYQNMRGKVSNRTINKELDYFSGFLRWCRREKKMQIPRVDYEKLPYSAPVPIILSPGEIIRFLSAAEEEPIYHAFFLTLYTLALRISAARGIKVQDFDFENRAVRVLQKGGNWKLLPVSDHVIESVKEVIKLNDLKAGDYVFSVRGGEPIQNTRKAIDRICKRAGIKKKVHNHLFRHSLATHFVAAGVNLRTVQDYLDHAEVTTTEVYTHIAVENLRSAQNAVVSTRKINDSVDSLPDCDYNI